MDTFNIFIKLICDLFTKNSGEFLAALTGAFFGAASAYMFENSKEKTKKLAEQHGAIIRAQMVLIGQFNTVRNIQKQYLDPFRSDPQREAKLTRFQVTDTSLRVAYDSISFLLMTKPLTPVLEIHAAEQTYICAIESLKLRNEVYEQFHKRAKLEKIDMHSGQCTVRVEDPRDIKLLKDLTNNLYQAVDDACGRLSLQIKELHKAGKLVDSKKEYLLIAGEK